jgi:pimeloyl-ACP methyl ester carboxylesterase
MNKRIGYKSCGGRGPQLILVHGYGGSPKHWDSVVETLSGSFRIHTLQLSQLFDSKNPLLFGVQVEVLIQYIEQNFLTEKIHIAGVSYGATLLWAAKIKRPDLFEQIILINPLLPQALKWMQSLELRTILRIPFHQQILQLLLTTYFGRKVLHKAAELFRPGDAQFFHRIKKMDRRMIFYISAMITHFSWILRHEDWKFWENKSALLAHKNVKLVVSNKDPLFNLNGYDLFLKNQLKGAEMKIIFDSHHLINISHPIELSEFMTKTFILSQDVAS